MRPLWYSLRDTMRASCSKWDAGGYSTGWEKRSNSISRHGQSLLGFDTVRRRWQCIQRKCDKSRWTTDVNCNACTLLYLLRYIFSKYPLEYLRSDITVMVGWAFEKPTYLHVYQWNTTPLQSHTSTQVTTHLQSHTSTQVTTHLQSHTSTQVTTHLQSHTSTQVTTHLQSHTSNEVTTHLQSHKSNEVTPHIQSHTSTEVITHLQSHTSTEVTITTWRKVEEKEKQNHTFISRLWNWKLQAKAAAMMYPQFQESAKPFIHQQLHTASTTQPP